MVAGPLQAKEIDRHFHRSFEVRMGADELISEHRFIDDRTEALRVASYKLAITPGNNPETLSQAN